MIRQHAMGLLARREHAKNELRRKLLRKGYDDSDIGSVLESLAAENLQSDERYIEVYVQSKVSRGFGPRYVLRELRQKGVSVEQVECYLQQANIDWFGQMQAVWKKKYSHPPMDARASAQHSRFLLQRGFEPDSVRILIRDLQNGID